MINYLKLINKLLDKIMQINQLLNLLQDKVVFKQLNFYSKEKTLSFNKH